MNNVNLSIILTYYNAENYISSALSSIYIQEEEFKKNNILDPSIEVILVNDCSTDNSKNIVISFLNNIKDDQTFIWKHFDNIENVGCGKSRKNGIEHSSGKRIMFLDADDYYINNNFVYNIYNIINKNDSDILEFGIRSNTLGRERYQVSKDIMIFSSDQEKFKALFTDNVIRFYAWTKVIKRELVEKVPYSEERTYEDVLTIPKWIEIANKITVLPIIGINYRYASNSITTNNDLDKRLGTIKALCELCKYFKDKNYIVKRIYRRAMADLETVLVDHDSDDPGFMEMMKYNIEMLEILYNTKINI